LPQGEVNLLANPFKGLAWICLLFILFKSEVQFYFSKARWLLWSPRSTEWWMPFFSIWREKVK